MANLSNINNKFLFTDGDFLKIGNLAPINNISGTESGISVTNSNVASITLDNTAASGKRYVMYSSGNGSLVFWDGDAGSARLQIDSAGNATFAGNVISGGSGTFASSVTVNTNDSNILTLNRNSTVGGYMVFRNDNSDKLYIGSRGTVSGSGGTGYDIFTVAGNDLKLFTSATLALTLDSSQNATFSGTGTFGDAVRINGTTTTGLVISSLAGSSNGLKLYNNSTTDNAYIYNHFSGNLEIGTNNATVLTMTGTASTFAGNVNITGGTTSGLNITTSGTQDTININRAASNDNAITKYQTASVDKWIVGLRNTSDDNFRFYSYGTATDVLTINQADGNVTFDRNIIGNAGYTTEIGTFGTNSAGAIKRIRMGSGGEVIFGDSTNTNPIGVTEGAWNTFTDTDFMSIYSRNSLRVYGYPGGATQLMHVADDGTWFNNTNVGIGTTSPTNQLHVHTETDNAYGIRIEGSTNNVAGVWTGLGIGGENANTKSALLFEDTVGSYARGKLHLCVNNGADQTSATPADAKLTITPAGDVGIGTAAPGDLLEVMKDGGAIIRMHDPGNNSWKLKADTDFHIYDDSLSDYLTIKNSGNVGIGVTGPNQKLEVAGNIRIDSRSKLGSGEVDNITFTKDRPDASTGTYEMGAIRSFTTNGYSGGMTFYCGRHTGGGAYALIPTMTIGHTTEIGLAYVGIGTTTPSGKLTVETTGNHLHLRNSAAASGRYWNFDPDLNSRLYVVSNTGTGVYIDYASTSWSSTSDESIKENIKPLENVLDKIKDYKCIEYNLIDDETKGKKIGFIAQDWENDFAPIISKDDDGLLGMKYTETIPILLKAIQELKADNDSLKARIETLENN